MKLDRRLSWLEAEVVQLEQKRQALVANHLALSAAFVALIPLISSASTAQYDVAKSKAMDRLTNEFLLLEFSEAQSGAVTEALEEVFCALDAAHGAMDQPPPMLS